VVRPGDWNSARNHVGVADGLDLFQAALLGEQIEGGKNLVQEVDDLLRANVSSEGGKADQIGEENGSVGVVIDDVQFAGFHASSDGFGQNVLQKLFGLFAFGLELIKEFLEVAAFPTRRTTSW